MSRPLLQLLEPGPCGAAIAWYEAESRELALEATLRIVQEFLALPQIESLEIVSAVPVLSVTAASVREFLAVAPSLLNHQLRHCIFDLWFNGAPTGFKIGHLDQSVAGVHFGLVGDCRELERERLFRILKRTLQETAQENPGVECDFGSWFDGRV